AQRQPDGDESVRKASSKAKTSAASGKGKAAKISFSEKHRLAELPELIARLEAEIGKLQELMADPELFTREPVKFRKATEALSARQEALAAAEEEWLVLEEKAG